MSGTLRKSLPSWRESARAHGFGILCIKGPEGEHFAIVPVDPDKFVEQFSAYGFDGVSMSEAELRARLGQAGFSEADIDAGILLSRDWATTRTLVSN
jgi:hypothetical protein